MPVLIAFATFYTGQWALSAKHLNMALSHPGVLRGVLAAGLYLAVFLIPQVIHVMPAPWDTRIGKYMLDNAGQQMSALHGAPGFFSAGVSLIICLAYAAAALAAAAIVITGRDA